MGSFPSKSLPDKQNNNTLTPILNTNGIVPEKNKRKSLSTQILLNNKISSVASVTKEKPIDLTTSTPNQLIKSNNIGNNNNSKTVIDIFLDSLTFDDVILNEHGIVSFSNHCATRSKEKLFSIYLLCKDYRMKHDHWSFQEIKIFISIHFEPLINDISIKEILPEIEINKIVHSIDVKSTNVPNITLLDKVNEIIIQKLKETEFNEWKKSKFAALYMANRTKLYHLIHDHHAMFYFEKFLALEYSSENIDFYEAVKLYVNSFDSLDNDTKQRSAEFLLRLYIDQNAPIQVNISSSIRVYIEDNILIKKNITKNLFGDAWNDIFKLMSRDSWPRYKRSKCWNEYITSYTIEEDDENINDLQIKENNLNTLNNRRKLFLEYIGDVDYDTVMKSKIGKDCFSKFNQAIRQRDGSVDFLYDVTEYKKALKQDHMSFKLKAKQIFDKYFDLKAPYPVKIPDKIVETLKEKVNHEVGEYIFDRAAEITLKKLRDKKVFERFKQTALYTKYRLLVMNSG